MLELTRISPGHFQFRAPADRYELFDIQLQTEPDRYHFQLFDHSSNLREAEDPPDVGDGFQARHDSFFVLKGPPLEIAGDPNLPLDRGPCEDGKYDPNCPHADFLRLTSHQQRNVELR